MMAGTEAGRSGFEVGNSRDLFSQLRLWGAGLFPRLTAVLSVKHAEPPSARHPAGVMAQDRLRLFEEQVLPHLDAAYNFARFLCRDADAAQDVVQDAFLRAYRGFDGYRGGDAKAWLFAIVRNCFNAWHQKRRHVQHFEQPIYDDISGDDEASSMTSQPVALEETPEMSVLRGLEARQIREMIGNLAPHMREVLVLRDLEELSYKQIAEIVGVPVGTVMSRLARARQEFGAAWRELDAKGSR